jgi:hypothetical protein
MNYSDISTVLGCVKEILQAIATPPEHIESSNMVRIKKTKRRRIMNLRSKLVGILAMVFAIALVMVQPLFVSAQKATISSSEMSRVSNGTVVAGSASQLVRNNNGLTTSVNTSDLTPGVYTLWWVIFNNPENCVVPHQCSVPADLLDPSQQAAVQSSAVNAAGHLVSSNGIGNFGAWIGIGGPYSGELLAGPGLLDIRGADILLVVRYHGPALQHQLIEQMTTFTGGCAVNTCFDDQFAYYPGN